MGKEQKMIVYFAPKSLVFESAMKQKTCLMLSELNGKTFHCIGAKCALWYSALDDQTGVMGDKLGYCQLPELRLKKIILESAAK